MTANILVRGHIELIDKLTKKGEVVIGLLTAKALKGYKTELVPYQDRYYLLELAAFPIDQIVPQDSLNPEKNIKKYRCDALASGDRFEPEELQVIKKLKLKKIQVSSGQKLHSSDIVKKICVSC